jgi:hypothetical protein
MHFSTLASQACQHAAFGFARRLVSISACQPFGSCPVTFRETAFGHKI